RAGALSERHRRGVLLSEAGAGITSAVARGGGAPIPFTEGRGGRGAAGGSRARLDGQSRVSRTPPACGPRRGPGAPGRIAGGPGSGSRDSLGPDPRGGAGGRVGAQRLWSCRLAQDVRFP